MPGDELRRAFDVLEQAWAEVVHNGEAPDRKTPAKDSINCWVGCCGMPTGSVSLKTSLTYEQQPWVSAHPDAYDVQRLLEYTSCTPVLDSGTYRPIYDWCLSVEHTRLAQAYQACKAVHREMGQCELIEDAQRWVHYTS